MAKIDRLTYEAVKCPGGSVGSTSCTTRHRTRWVGQGGACARRMRSVGHDIYCAVRR